MPTVLVRACEGESEIDISVSVAFLRDLLSSRSFLRLVLSGMRPSVCLTQCEKQPDILGFLIV